MTTSQKNPRPVLTYPGPLASGHQIQNVRVHGIYYRVVQITVFRDVKSCSSELMAFQRNFPFACSGQMDVSGKIDAPPHLYASLQRKSEVVHFNVKLHYAHITVRFSQHYCHVDIISHQNIVIFFGVRRHNQAHILSKSTAGVQRDVFNLTKILMECHDKNDTTYCWDFHCYQREIHKQ